jgi:hypothetical protein
MIEPLHGMRIDELELDGIVAGVLEVVGLSVEAGIVAVIACEADAAVSIRGRSSG